METTIFSFGLPGNYFFVPSYNQLVWQKDKDFFSEFKMVHWCDIILLDITLFNRPFLRRRYLATTTRIHLVFALFLKFFQFYWRLKDNSTNFHKKTTNWRILIYILNDVNPAYWNDLLLRKNGFCAINTSWFWPYFALSNCKATKQTKMAAI